MGGVLEGAASTPSLPATSHKAQSFLSEKGIVDSAQEVSNLLEGGVAISGRGPRSSIARVQQGVGLGMSPGG